MTDTSEEFNTAWLLVDLTIMLQQLMLTRQDGVKIRVFWDVTQCYWGSDYRRFGGSCPATWCHNPEDVNLNNTAVRTTNLTRF